MIPERMPPPPDAPIGWSPNALGMTNAQIASAIQLLTAAELDAFLLGAASLVQRSLTLPFTAARALNSAPQTMVSAVGLAAGQVIQPLWWAVQNANGATAYSGALVLSLQYAGLAVDIGESGVAITVSSVANIANRQTRDMGASNMGSGNLVANLDVQVRATTDRTLGSGFVLVTCGFVVMDQLA